ncbi:long-chain-fatty-acid--CoA ligase [Frondihabitans sucicola]|uniref:Long-chain-fatty-acid--CoA ligase n=1 Tax=Frondihabitans sucicola TaxID=1268041 RepID=A0ABN6XWW3_9MICO|nr:class I adenylate-forming enzyme family protein [Frondihabitans sucicola]BDZ47858.1 long-chain-fatty-acid--CoA ligase [Frondihabitans sucicola]
MNRALPLFDWAFSQSDKACIVTDSETYTYGDMTEAIRTTAAALSSIVHRGTPVGLYIDSTPNFLVHQYAVFYLGGVVMPLNRSMKPNEIDDIVRNIGLEVVVADTHLELESAPALYEVSGEFSSPPLTGAVPTMEQLDADDGAMILQTSGSTGRPKGVRLSLRNLAANYDATYRWMNVGNHDRILLPLPIFNTYGLNQGINLMAMTGATLRLLRRFTPEGFQRALDDTSPTFIPMVPTMVTRLFQAGVRYDEVATVGIGAAASPTQIAADAWAVFPNAFLIFGYGLTEGTAIASQNRVGTFEHNTGEFASAGRIMPGVDVRLDDSTADDGRGEILIHGESVFSAYIGTEEARPVVDGWLHTGDIGTFTDGRLSIVDRRRELIIRGGQNIYPGEVERLISAHPAVLEAAVVGAPDADLGELPVGFVVLRNGSKTSPDEIIEWLRPQAASFKIPAALTVLDSMPKTPTGKIRKLDLRDLVSGGLTN